MYISIKVSLGTNDLALFKRAILFEITLHCASLCLSHYNCSSRIMPSDFFSKTRLILLSPNVSTGLFSIEVRRCIDPIDQLQVSQKVINKKMTFETDSTTSTSVSIEIFH